MAVAAPMLPLVTQRGAASASGPAISWRNSRPVLYALFAALVLLLFTANLDLHIAHWRAPVHVHRTPGGDTPDDRGGGTVVVRAATRAAAIELPPDYARYTANETLLRVFVIECAKREDSVLYIDQHGALAVVSPNFGRAQRAALDPEVCPPMDIMLHGSERGIGMCTDVALYAVHAGARIIPKVDAARYDAACGRVSARVFLETIYDGWLGGAGASGDEAAAWQRRRFMLPNFENFYVGHLGTHAAMGTMLCKHHTCERLMRQYVADKQMNQTQVRFMGHTSMDPSVGLETVVRRFDQMLHVKGKSPHKYTLQLLQCYKSHAEFPRLTVVGESTLVEQMFQAPHITLLGGGGGEQTNMGGAEIGRELIAFDKLRQLQNSVGIHVCVSEREGFGHYINEARAVGAFVISTDHPPMNELVTKERGALVVPQAVRSYDFQALQQYSPLNAIITAWNICPVLDQVLRMSQAELAAKGAAARTAFLEEKFAFYSQLQTLKEELYNQWVAELRAAGRRVPQPLPGPAAPDWRWPEPAPYPVLGVDAPSSNTQPGGRRLAAASSAVAFEMYSYPSGSQGDASLD